METDEIKDVVDFVEDEGGEEIIAASIDAYGGPDAEDYVSETAKKTTSGVISGAVLGGVASGGDPEATVVGGVLGGIKRGAVAPVKEKVSHELDERTEKPLGEYASVGGAVEFVKESPEVISGAVSDVLGMDDTGNTGEVMEETSFEDDQMGGIEDVPEGVITSDIKQMGSEDWTELNQDEKHDVIETLADSDELDNALYGTLSDLDRQDVSSGTGSDDHVESGGKSGAISGTLTAAGESFKEDPVGAFSSGVRKGGATAAADAVVEQVWDNANADEGVEEAVEWASNTKDDIADSYLGSADGAEQDGAEEGVPEEGVDDQEADSPQSQSTKEEYEDVHIEIEEEDNG
jgi:hypothetical protein